MGPDVTYMQDLYTAPHARGEGVATQLIDAVSVWSRARGIGRVYWNTHESNPARARLYDLVGTHKGFVKYQLDL